MSHNQALSQGRFGAVTNKKCFLFLTLDSIQTGTLTEGDLDLAGVCEAREGQFQESVPDPMALPTDSLLVQTMASCHSLVKIEGELTGYPIDIKLFEAIN